MGGRVDHWAPIRDRSVRALNMLAVSEPVDDKLVAKQKRLNKICAIIKAGVAPTTGPFAAKKIMGAVAKAHGVTFDDLIGQSRARHIVLARHHAMWEVRHHTKLSTSVIGVLFSGRDHTTVVHGCQQHEKRRAAL